jgi:hypothetical protein
VNHLTNFNQSIPLSLTNQTSDRWGPVPLLEKFTHTLELNISCLKILHDFVKKSKGTVAAFLFHRICNLFMKVVRLLNYLSTKPWRRWRTGCIDPLIRVLDSSWKWVVGSTPKPFCSRVKSPCYPLDRRLGGSQNRCARHGDKKNLASWDPNSGSSAVQPVARRYTNWAIQAPRI